MKKHLLLSFTFSIILSQLIWSQSTLFTDYFDAFVAGEKLACQDSINWTTWSNAPCGTEDALVDSTHYSSASKSVVILSGNDLIKKIDNLTTGNYSVVFKFYIPAGKSGYFNVLQLFNGNASQWGFEAIFNTDGSGSINAGGENAAVFNYPQDTWHTTEVKINILDTNDIGAFYINGAVIHTWKWSTGADGNGNLKQIGAVNFYGSESTNEMYFDNFQIWDNLGTVAVDDYINYPEVFALYQNFPNPFNPSTKIVYSIAEADNVTLTILNALGEKVAILTNGYKETGTYEVNFDAEELTSGIYFYTLQSGTVSITKKMLLIK